MGNYIRRNRRRRREQVETTMDEGNDDSDNTGATENVNEQSGNSIEISPYNEPDLASILSFLLRRYHYDFVFHLFLLVLFLN